MSITVGGKFKGCIAHIYDINGNEIAVTKIYEHNSVDNTITILNLNHLSKYQKCKLLILSTPKPYSCLGTIRCKGTNIIIGMFKGQEKEDRKTNRFKLSSKAKITRYLYNKKEYKLHKNIDVDIIDISVSGIRILAKLNTLSKGDKFSIYIQIKDTKKTLKAKVINLKEKDESNSEYGCLLLGDDDE